jgi:hypothetical protein
MKHSSLVLGFIAAVAVMSPAEAYIGCPLMLSRASGRLSMGLSARPPKVAPCMQMNPNDKTFRRASAVSLRAEGDENNGPMGRYVFLLACMCVCTHVRYLLASYSTSLETEMAQNSLGLIIYSRESHQRGR